MFNFLQIIELNKLQFNNSLFTAAKLLEIIPKIKKNKHLLI